MSDDLVKRLRRVSMDLGIPSTTTLDSKVVAHAADRIEALEAKLAKAVEELDAAAKYHEGERTWWDAERAINIRATLAELTGGKDD